MRIFHALPRSIVVRSVKFGSEKQFSNFPTICTKCFWIIIAFTTGKWDCENGDIVVAFMLEHVRMNEHTNGLVVRIGLIVMAKWCIFFRFILRRAYHVHSIALNVPLVDVGCSLFFLYQLEHLLSTVYITFKDRQQLYAKYLQWSNCFLLSLVLPFSNNVANI